MSMAKCCSLISANPGPCVAVECVPRLFVHSNVFTPNIEPSWWYEMIKFWFFVPIVHIAFIWTISGTGENGFRVLTGLKKGVSTTLIRFSGNPVVVKWKICPGFFLNNFYVFFYLSVFPQWQMRCCLYSFRRLLGGGA